MSLAPGTRLGPYEILAVIGAGGMGEVYKARDTRLDRIVAIKQLKGQHTARFQQEARAIATLNHAHICQIYDVGPDYLVLEYVDGSPVRGPLGVEEAVRLAIQIAEALDAAHRRGILHRDLKPGNVQVTESGVKLLDFGLAKLLVPPSDTDVTNSVEGTVLGTAAYMSPEQAQGKAVDARSDIFSFGAVLYEMLSGTQAFNGGSMVDILSAVVRDEPAPLHAPEALARIVRRCLHKSCTERFQTMAEVHAALKQVSLASKETQPSIAVLPFVNRSGDADNEYFSDGLSEDLINALSRMPGLKVASRTSAFRFRGSDLDIRQIARQLDVAKVVEGSVRRAGARLRVTAQLVEAESGYQLWSERYDRQMADVFEIQDEIVASIMKAVVPALLGEAAHAVERPTENTEAYELYLKGRHYWHQRSPSTLRLATKCFEQAIELDPQYALAYAGLADCYGILRVYGWISADNGRPPARAAMTKAVAIAPLLSEVNFSRAFYTFFFERNWRDAGPYFQKAVDINPRSSMAQVYYGIFLAMEGRADEAAAQTILARQLDPLSPLIHTLASTALCALWHFEEGERAALHVLELQPDYLIGLWFRGLAQCGLGRNSQAIDALERAITLSRAPLYVGLLGLAYARAGRRDDAIRLLRELEDRGSRGEYVPAFALLSIHAGLGDVPAIRDTLARLVAEPTPPLIVRVTGGHLLEAFRSDPEIDRLLSELYG